MTINNDAVLITKFVQGQTSFAASQDLKIELAFDSTQLLMRRQGLIACLKQENQLPTVLVRRGCVHWNFLHHTLLKHGFVPLLNAETDKVFAKYQKRELPPGYKLNATDASTLWKEWWTNIRGGNHNRIELDVLLFTRNKWVAIRDITCKQGVFFIKTLGPEVVRHPSQPVIWLNRTTRKYLEKDIYAQQSDGQASTSSYHQTAKQAPRWSTVEQIEIAPELKSVVRVHQGKLCVMSSLGEIIIEGNNLKVHLNPVQSPGSHHQANGFSRSAAIGF